jgi:hypothetical protein
MSQFHFHLNLTRKEKGYKKVKISSDFKGKEEGWEDGKHSQ